MTGRAIVLPATVYYGIDCTGALTDAHCEVLVSNGRSFVGRYTRPDGVVRDAPKPGGDWNGCDSLSHEEAARILRWGLMIEPFQFGDYWPQVGYTAAGGHRLGLAARSCARQLGIPAAVHLWPDYEGGHARDAGAPAGIAALEAFSAAACPDIGQACGLYYDRNQPLTAAQLWGLRGISSYHRAGTSNAPSPDVRGHAIQQGLMRAGWASPDHPRWCQVFGCDCPATGREGVTRCPRDGSTYCLIPAGAPGHDPDTMTPDSKGELPILWGA